MSQVSREDLYRFLARHKLGVLSYVSPAGAPRSAMMGYAVTPEIELIFDTVKSSRKYGDLIARPACAFVVAWEGEKTVQFEGRAEELAGEELARCQEIYFRAFPDGPARLSWPGIVYFVVKPLWVRYTDYLEQPPLIQEFRFGG